jgi:hypothetical protein
MREEQPVLHGYYSKKMDELFGSILYEALEGGAYVVTAVCRVPGTQILGWPDGKDVGLVTKYIRRVDNGLYGDFNDEYFDLLSELTDE